MKKLIKRIIDCFPHVKNLKARSGNTYFPNGHFYSPVIDIEAIKKREHEIWKHEKTEGIKGISLNTESQKALLGAFENYYADLPFAAEKQEGLRYYYQNIYYGYTDAIMLYSMMRHFQPKRIIEIGSGFSSAVMLDTNDLHFDGSLNITFIDPYADRLFSLMTAKDKQNIKVIEQDAQQIPLETFEVLEAGDILFIDSTHISKTGSDVNYILFEILPVLQKGVLIHFHDVFYPFEYPKKWVFDGFNWNEDYILKAFLMYNSEFEIKIFPDYLHKLHPNCFINMPLCYQNTGGNIWIQKI
ncbi:hypothetical protein B0A58_04785 [Flavobacterium branchiophilum NBRC 15030 = ATCC 35035]|uniref:Methyltransferase family protein n=1 Tax=Flavobacterium branchiophilum TaxID=55197 RepID=A0A543G5E2_9FLAO|nr:class I SAM-dependent methyltransferase [Flavobacterium branchiophilum]OXA78059.1 hypothetical protein B0A58_04785 [Flavobacterium branchiophilum NBRC 15030 = ATCC 35035]TQM41265.1 methyltransferase family protein [Flavobacterium branchiophilum]GEM54861.1 hypothetical protein FB1_10820 [Flavobacterium branchiophilum NBRC 15030 = ATCC 35035]